MTSGPTNTTPIITATHFYDFLFCPHRIYLDEYCDPGLMDEESDFEKLLWERGVLHENDVLKELGLEVERVEGETLEEREQETLRLMKSGASLIYQGLVSAPRMRGRPDLLERSRGKSVLGSHYYVPVELKSGSAYENKDTKKIKEQYGLQLCFYADVLEKMQGVHPESGKVVDGDFKEVDVALQPFTHDYSETHAQIVGILEKRIKSEPVICSTCGQCHWRSHCMGWAKQTDDLTLVRKLNGDKRAALRKSGIHTIAELASLEKQKTLPVIEGISSRTLNQIVRRAAVLKRNVPMLVGPVQFPNATIELFFDIETEPLEGICYLYGVVERRGGQERYISFFADSPREEEKTWREFWAYVSGLGDYHMYHYAPYEKVQLKALFEKYSCDEDLFNEFFDNSTDLYREVDRHTEWPSHSYSIKTVSKLLGFKYSEADPGGLKAAKWYVDYAGNPADNISLKERIIQYNREDCEAMIILKDWLEEKSKEFGRKRGS